MVTVSAAADLDGLMSDEPPMIAFDGIVFTLQRLGGVSVMFHELLARLPTNSYVLIGFQESFPPMVAVAHYRLQRPRLLERYRPAVIGQDVEIFHSTYYRVPVANQCRVVTTVYDYIYERFASGMRRAVHSFQKNMAIARADRIICISESTRRDLIECSGSRYADRIVVIYNGVSNEYSPILGVQVQPQVIVVGARAGYKNFISVVYALAGMRDIKLVCVGGGAFTKDEIHLMERHIKGRYRYAGYVTNGELNREYNQSLCLVYPSLYEGFGIPIVEAMRAGCPVVAVNRSSIPEVAGDAAVLMEAGQPDEVREAIETVMVTQAREALVKRGRLQSLRFSWDETFKQTRGVYEGLLGTTIA